MCVDENVNNKNVSDSDTNKIETPNVSDSQSLENSVNSNPNGYFEDIKKEAVNSTSNAIPDGFNDTSTLTDRDVSYKQLIADYVELSNERSKTKEDKKKDFYSLIKGSLQISGFIFSMFALRALFSSTDELIAIIPVIIAGFVAFLGEFISLPLIIARYLFNNSEDDNMTKVILHTQDFDISRRGLIKEIEKTLNDNGKNNR